MSTSIRRSILTLAIKNEGILAKAIVVKHLLSKDLVWLAGSFPDDALGDLESTPPEVVWDSLPLAKKGVWLPIVGAALINIGMPIKRKVGVASEVAM